MTASGIDRRVLAGLLLIEYRGVYRVGHRAPSTEARYLAAVLACGPKAALRGRAAGHLLGVIKGRPPAPEVCAPTRRQPRGIRTRRARIDSREITTYRGIPVTTVPRTLVDLAATLSLSDLARACHEAEILHGTAPAQIEAVLRANAPGAARLRKVIHGDVPVVLSKLERRFLELLSSRGLALPQTNRPAGTRRVDCRWPAQRLTVELDGYRYHHSRHAWEQDRLREREARARGDEFRRYSYGDVFETPAAMLTELTALLT